MKLAVNALFLILISSWMLGCSSVRHASDSAQPTTTNNVNRSGYVETGKASFYSDKHQWKKTASGELYNYNLNTAAHKVLPFGTTVRVTNMENGKSVVVKINDRGPFVKNRILDLSQSAFGSIAGKSSGIIEVKIEVID